MKKNIVLVAFVMLTGVLYAQEETESLETKKSNIQEYTPSKLLSKGQWDIKWFNNLYTQTKSTFTDDEEPRETFFTSTLEVFTGLSESKRVNIGVLLNMRSNVINDRNALDVFKFDGDHETARSGITSIAPAVKIAPFKSLSNFSIQSSFRIPLIDNEVENGVFLAQKGYTFQNRLFYDYTFTGNKFQLFTELNTEYHFGEKEESFANDSFGITPGLFISYFPNQKSTVLALVQHSQRLDLGNNFEQNFTAIGGGAKYQLTEKLNIEALYTNFVRGENTGLGQTFNLGLRLLF